MQNQEWWEFTEQAKQQGKIRFRGMSGHGSHLVEALDYAINQDLVDVILVAFNFGQDPDFYDRLRHTFHFVALQPELPRLLEKAKANDVGVLAMKTLMGARLNDMRPYERPGSTYVQAAFRWVLSSRKADALLISMNSRAEIDEYLSASGEPRVSEHDLQLLARYARMQAARYCQHGCSVCEDSCPRAVPIAEVLRTRMYDVDYGDPGLARSDYARLGDGAGACLSCGHRACLSACPNGIPIAELTRDAARRLA
jgi:predicted aldo/keto reductase-like oxidoreductase